MSNLHCILTGLLELTFVKPSVPKKIPTLTKSPKKLPEKPLMKRIPSLDRFFKEEAPWFL